MVSKKIEVTINSESPANLANYSQSNKISQYFFNDFIDFSDKLTNKTIDDPLLEREGSNSKMLVKPPKFKAKVFFK